MTTTEIAEQIYVHRVASWPDYRPCALEAVALEAFAAAEILEALKTKRHDARQRNPIPRPPPTSVPR